MKKIFTSVSLALREDQKKHFFVSLSYNNICTFKLRRHLSNYSETSQVLVHKFLYQFFSLYSLSKILTRVVFLFPIPEDKNIYLFFLKPGLSSLSSHTSRGMDVKNSVDNFEEQ